MNIRLSACPPGFTSIVRALTICDRERESERKKEWRRPRVRTQKQGGATLEMEAEAAGAAEAAEAAEKAEEKKKEEVEVDEAKA